MATRKAERCHGTAGQVEGTRQRNYEKTLVAKKIQDSLHDELFIVTVFKDFPFLSFCSFEANV